MSHAVNPTAQSRKDEEVSLLPNRSAGLAILRDGNVESHNPELYRVLSDLDERPEEAGPRRLAQLMADPAVREMLASLARRPEADVEIVPDWWPGQVIGINAAVMGDVVVLAVHNWTAVHRLANMQQDFVANVSHELRTPLTSIRMAAESLQLGAMGNEKMRAKFLSNIQREADRLTRLVNELLVVANLHGRPTLHMANFTFPELAQEVIQTLEPHAQLNNVNLVLTCPDELPVYNGDRDRIQQVLINLVDNAIKFTPASGKVSLDIGHDAEANALVIKVVDTGIGIPEIDRPRIFDRFYRVDKSRSRVTGGVGLGLSIVKDIIVAHGGTIDVNSELNVGTTFTITLPLVRDR
jgi:two-component system phosphate regulon sensor histidine kinase PhoR